MASELRQHGFDEDWVDGLAPCQLQDEYAELIRSRSARQREQLHIQVSAAAVASDGGKFAKKMDSELAVASESRNVARKQAKEEERETLDVQAGIERENAAVAGLWRRD